MDMLISFGDLVALSPQVFSRPILLNSTDNESLKLKSGSLDNVSNVLSTVSVLFLTIN